VEAQHIPLASGRKQAAVAWNITSKIVRKVVTIGANHIVLGAATLMAKEFVGSVVITNSSKYPVFSPNGI
jgi:hypothetical protein